MNDQQKFLFDILSQIEDCICDAEYDLGPESVLYVKLKELKETVETYQESLWNILFFTKFLKSLKSKRQCF